MKIKTSDLIRPALDWAVANALGMSWWTRANANWDNNYGYTDWILDGKELCRFEFDGAASRAGHWRRVEVFTPSTDWSQAGPVIEREHIDIKFCAGFWRASKDDRPTSSEYAEEDGPTALIAAMRCYVASKLGDEVDVPEELT